MVADGYFSGRALLNQLSLKHLLQKENTWLRNCTRELRFLRMGGMNKDNLLRTMYREVEIEKEKWLQWRPELILRQYFESSSNANHKGTQTAKPTQGAQHALPLSVALLPLSSSSSRSLDSAQALSRSGDWISCRRSEQNTLHQQDSRHWWVALKLYHHTILFHQIHLTLQAPSSASSVSSAAANQ